MRLSTIAVAVCSAFAVVAAETPESPRELAAKLSALRQDGTSLVRARMEIKGGSNASCQLQIKSRRSKGSAEVVYQVLWPKERMGEAVVVRRNDGSSLSGFVLAADGSVRKFDSGQAKQAVLGSDLSYEDLVDDFYSWSDQTVAGTESVNRVPCAVLVSKPGKGDRSSYGSVKTWVDTRRMVPLRVEKLSASGELVRRIETTSVANDDQRHPIPAKLVITGPGGGSSTEIDGSKIRHDVTISDRDFTPEGLKELGGKKSAD